MSLYKRGSTWHFDFIYRGRRYQGSTDQTNINKAKLVEAKIRSDLGLARFGIVQPKSEPFADFLDKTFSDYVHRHAKARRTAMFYDEKVKRLLSYDGWKNLNLADIDENLIGKYTDWRARLVGVTSINGELATLRKALNLAYEWQLIQRKPRVRRLPGEKPREFVVSAQLEAEYLAAASYPLKQAAILILDIGLRPEECVRLKKEDVTRSGVTVRDGKSVNATRSLPLTERATCQIESLSALWPDSEWVFPGRKGNHLQRGSLDNLHTKLRKAQDWPDAFVLYSFRHTFATRLAESGADPFHMMKLMGHADIRMTSRYTHPQPEGLAVTMKRKEALDRIRRGEVDHEEASESSGQPYLSSLGGHGE